MYARHQYGKESEEQAKSWLLTQSGYHFLQSNYRCRWGEIDLIFEHDLHPDGSVELVFVEVRARGVQGWVSAAESVDWKKQRRLQKTAAYFLSQYQGPARSMRFDLLYRDGEAWGHLPNLWLNSLE